MYLTFYQNHVKMIKVSKLIASDGLCDIAQPTYQQFGETKKF